MPGSVFDISTIWLPPLRGFPPPHKSRNKHLGFNRRSYSNRSDMRGRMHGKPRDTTRSPSPSYYTVPYIKTTEGPATLEKEDICIYLLVLVKVIYYHLTQTPRSRRRVVLYFRGYPQPDPSPVPGHHLRRSLLILCIFQPKDNETTQH